MGVKKTKTEKDSLSRRQFLAGSAAAAAFTIVKPSSVRGTQANSKIEVGFIGLGGRGRWIAEHLAKHGGYKITAVADYFPEVANKVGDAHGVDKGRRFSGLLGYKRMIASKVDAVFCETPPYCFPDHVSEAVGAGCHVYLAKPVACDVPGCLTVRKMGKIAAEKKQVFLIDFQTRTDAYHQEAIRRAHSGDIGNIGMLSSHYTDDGFSDPPKTKTIESRLQRLIWVNDIDLGGGMLVNAGIHALDVGMWIAQSDLIKAMGCSRVCKAGSNGDTKYVYSVTYEFANGMILNHRGEHLRNTQGFSCGCFAYGDRGFLESHYAGKVWIHSYKKGYRGGEVKGLYGDGMTRNIATFHNSIVNGIYDNPTVEPSINSTLATILGRQAAARNTSLTLGELIKENERLEVDFTGLKY